MKTSTVFLCSGLLSSINAAITLTVPAFTTTIADIPTYTGQPLTLTLTVPIGANGIPNIPPKYGQGAPTILPVPIPVPVVPQPAAPAPEPNTNVNSIYTKPTDTVVPNVAPTAASPPSGQSTGVPPHYDSTNTMVTKTDASLLTQTLTSTMSDSLSTLTSTLTRPSASTLTNTLSLSTSTRTLSSFINLNTPGPVPPVNNGVHLSLGVGMLPLVAAAAFANL